MTILIFNLTIPYLQKICKLQRQQRLGWDGDRGGEVRWGRAPRRAGPAGQDGGAGHQQAGDGRGRGRGAATGAHSVGGRHHQGGKRVTGGPDIWEKVGTAGRDSI